jgi:isoquinoline 1-oxidoreductase alpha subunit
MISFTVNGQPARVEVEPEKPLLWVLREDLNIVGPKYGCGVASCGACTVHVDGAPVRSCSMAASDVEGKTVLTIEGLALGTLHAVQKAWIELQVPQCGYCQPGFIMSAVALLKANPKPTDKDIDEVLSNICRCGTYSAIRRAVHRAAALLAGAT